MRYITVGSNGDWEELDASHIIFAVTDDWYDKHAGTDFIFDEDCDFYDDVSGILDHWHPEDLIVAKAKSER